MRQYICSQFPTKARFNRQQSCSLHAAERRFKHQHPTSIHAPMEPVQRVVDTQREYDFVVLVSCGSVSSLPLNCLKSILVSTGAADVRHAL